jgi:hypothetical protein
MSSIDRVRRRIVDASQDQSSLYLAELLAALQRGQPIDLRPLYELDYESFTTAIEMLRDWRLHRYADTARLAA